MPELGVAVIVLQQNRVLLTQREDFECWCLPGGGIDPNESLDAAAIREVYEETGLEVELTGLVCLLSKPHWGRGGTHVSVFVARPISTGLKADPNEVKAVDFFPVDQLPEPLMWDHKQLVTAAVAGTTGEYWVNYAKTPPRFADRAKLYAWRDQSGLTRQEAYYQLMREIDSQAIEVVLGKNAGLKIVEACE
ncbi:MAG: NUDIX domain-containing protein [Chloroflexota bacterium]